MSLKIKLTILLIIVVGAWLVKTKIIDSSTSKSTTAAQTAQVEKGTLVISVTSAGQVSANNSLTATTNASGVVTKVFVANDQSVKSGEKLVELELDQESQQTYTQALASYQSAQNSVASAKANLYSLQAAMLGKWDTFKELSESDEYKDASSANRSLPEFHIPEKEWLAAEAQYKNQQAVVAQAQTAFSSAAQSLRLASPIIYAPITGTVTGLSMMEGTVIARTNTSETSTGQTVANIVTNAQPTVSVSLTEVDVTKVSLGNKVTITIDALPDKTYTGKVISIDTVGSVSSGVTSYPAVIAFDTEAPEVFSNMSAQASIITETKSDIILVPTSAVQTQNGQSTVKVMKDGQEQSVAVETGVSSGTQIEIVSGLTQGDTIITSAAALVPAQTGGQTTSPFSGMGGGGFGGGAQTRMVR